MEAELLTDADVMDVLALCSVGGKTPPPPRWPFLVREDKFLTAFQLAQVQRDRVEQGHVPRGVSLKLLPSEQRAS